MRPPIRLPSRSALALAGALSCAVVAYGAATRGKSRHAWWEVRSPVVKGSRADESIAAVVSLGNLDRGLAMVAVMTAGLLVVRPAAAWVPFVAFAGTGVAVDEVAKPLFAHQLNGGLGYPSGHSSVAAASLVGFAVCVWPASRAAAVAAGCVAAALPVGVWAGDYHRLSEVLAGAGVALAAGTLTASLVPSQVG